MNKLNLLTKLALAGVASVAALTFPIKAEASSFIIDDFNRAPDSPTIPSAGPPAVDSTANGEGVSSLSTIDIGNTVMNILGGGPWSREFYADLLSGDEVQTFVCYGCQEGHAFSTTESSNGIFEWRYTGSTLDASEFDHFMVDYLDLADQPIEPGGVIELYFDGELAAQSEPLPGEEQPSLMLPLLFSPDSVSNVTIRINGVEGLNASPDNAKLVATPEPGTILGLLAVGGLGLGLKRKNKVKKSS